MVGNLLRIFRVIHWIRMFTSLVANSGQWTLSWGSCIPPFLCTYCFKLSANVRLRVLSGFPNEILHIFHLPHAWLTSHPSDVIMMEFIRLFVSRSMVIYMLFYRYGFKNSKIFQCYDNCKIYELSLVTAHCNAFRLVFISCTFMPVDCCIDRNT